MEPMILKPYKIRPFRLLLLAGLAVMLMLTASCASRVIEGRAPFVGVSLVELGPELLTVRFDISNENGVTMDIETIDLRIMVHDSTLIEHSSSEKLPVDANSSESVTVRQEPDDFTRTLLTSLSNGALDNLSITVTGMVFTSSDGTLRFEQEGYMYRVPGRPGQFRAAVTRSEKLVREDPR